jgi:hypothetical protein
MPAHAVGARSADWVPAGGNYSGVVLDLSILDLEEIANALADQTDYDHRWLIDPQTGQVAFWTSDTGIDGQTPVDLDELDLVCIDPLPSRVWYQDMADFAEAITDERAGRRLARAIQGKGSFRRFKDELHQEYPDLLPAWYAFGDARATRRAVRWLAENSLIDDEAADRFLAGHSDPRLPWALPGRQGRGQRDLPAKVSPVRWGSDPERRASSGWGLPSLCRGRGAR